MNTKRINAIERSLDLMSRLRNGEPIASWEYQNIRGHLRSLRYELKTESPATELPGVPEGIEIVHVYPQKPAPRKKARKKKVADGQTFLNV